MKRRMTGLKEALELAEHAPENRDYRDLLLAVIDRAAAFSELELRLLQFLEAATKYTAAEAAQRLVEIRAGINQ
ncbi:hypothetical protein [Rhodovulum euryhalinum]|uniref:Uncharacterized protein n=1 Tax=Rhodovulum euryhalinum TaxID=35805 RepID=A0A4R2KBN8_9RHOB|nr:hypothetical protein [Rhodovulum euryhalinum]TCO70244.1 hypothetical protein EV655_1108 [Rhodovulum euryhalinum]